MEILFAFLAALVGWQNGRLGRNEWKGIAVVVAGWTVVTTVALLPWFDLVATLMTLAVRGAIVGGGYALGVLLHRWRKPIR